MFRSSENARYVYTSEEHSNAECYYFHASEEPVEGYQSWKDYVKSFHDYEAGGNHVSMFWDEHIENFCCQFNAILRNDL